jgi:predicted lysophospholipase L1 biosynthesis ABC-type transport system permease subunit
MAAGIRMATEPGRGDRAVPVRSAFVGAAFAIAGLTAVFVFGASLERLATTPRRYGARFDFKIETNQDNACDTRDFGVAKLDGVASLDAICYANIQVGGRATFGWGSRPLRNSIGPEVIAGHAAATATEVALGAKTMRALRVRIGDTVDASSPVGHGVYRIVGQVVFPSLGDAQPLADGAWFTQDGLDTVIGPQTASSNANFTRVFLGRFAPGVNRRALVTRIEKLDFDPSGIPSQASAPQQPVEIHRLRQTGWFPIAIAALLAFLSLAAVGHALITGTRRRRRELALLKTLGFARRQVRFAISWQATFLSIASLIVGIPVGLLAGFAIWRAVANGLGVATDAVVPWLAFALIPLVILAMNAIAFFPARAAARMRPAVALRSE